MTVHPAAQDKVNMVKQTMELLWAQLEAVRSESTPGLPPSSEAPSLASLAPSSAPSAVGFSTPGGGQQLQQQGGQTQTDMAVDLVQDPEAKGRLINMMGASVRPAQAALGGS